MAFPSLNMDYLTVILYRMNTKLSIGLLSSHDKSYLKYLCICPKFYNKKKEFLLTS